MIKVHVRELSDRRDLNEKPHVFSLGIDKLIVDVKKTLYEEHGVPGDLCRVIIDEREPKRASLTTAELLGEMPTLPDSLPISELVAGADNTLYLFLSVGRLVLRFIAVLPPEEEFDVDRDGKRKLPSLTDALPEARRRLKPIYGYSLETVSDLTARYDEELNGGDEEFGRGPFMCFPPPSEKEAYNNKGVCEETEEEENREEEEEEEEEEEGKGKERKGEKKHDEDACFDKWQLKGSYLGKDAKGNDYITPIFPLSSGSISEENCDVEFFYASRLGRELDEEFLSAEWICDSILTIRHYQLGKQARRSSSSSFAFHIHGFRKKEDNNDEDSDDDGEDNDDNDVKGGARPSRGLRPCHRRPRESSVATSISSSSSTNSIYHPLLLLPVAQREKEYTAWMDLADKILGQMDSSLTNPLMPTASGDIRYWASFPGYSTDGRSGTKTKAAITHIIPVFGPRIVVNRPLCDYAKLFAAGAVTENEAEEEEEEKGKAEKRIEQKSSLESGDQEQHQNGGVNDEYGDDNNNTTDDDDKKLTITRKKKTEKIRQPSLLELTEEANRMEDELWGVVAQYAQYIYFHKGLVLTEEEVASILGWRSRIAKDRESPYWQLQALTREISRFMKSIRSPSGIAATSLLSSGSSVEGGRDRKAFSAIQKRIEQERKIAPTRIKQYLSIVHRAKEKQSKHLKLLDSQIPEEEMRFSNFDPDRILLKPEHTTAPPKGQL